MFYHTNTLVLLFFIFLFVIFPSLKDLKDQNHKKKKKELQDLEILDSNPLSHSHLLNPTPSLLKKLNSNNQLNTCTIVGDVS